MPFAKRGGYLARAVRPGNFSAVTGAYQMVLRDVLSRSEAATRNSPPALTTQTFALGCGWPATAPSLRPMQSCTTTSSPRAAGKRATRKNCAAGSASKHCSCGAGLSSSWMATRGSGRTYPPTVSTSCFRAK